MGAATTTAVPLPLLAGQKYAVQVLHKEGAGGDFVQVAMQEAGGTTPATYAVNGRQYVVIACGGGKMGTKSGDAYVAFALPKASTN